MQYLTLDQRRKLLRYCRDDLFLLVKALIYTGARPGEIARCRVEDFDPTTGALVLRSAKGSRKKIVERRFVLSGDGLKFFRQQHRLKTPRAFLFTTAGGSQWVKWLWSKPIRQAVAAADLPQGTTAYVIRHSVISDWIQGGIDVGTVAKSTGTSIQMINDYYFKSLPDAVAVELSRICVI
jgi:integrase